MSQSNKFLLASLLVLVFAASPAFAQLDVYLYNENVVGDVNIGAFLENGEVDVLDGTGNARGSMKYVYAAPAPAPYPQVQLWEKDIERLGRTSFRVDGIRFVNHGTHWVKNKKALVLWEIEIPNAASRLPSEFEQDLTLSLWVDWNGDKMWSKSEAMIREHINIHSYFPTTEGIVHVYYLTSFHVPKVDDIVVDSKAGKEDPPGQEKQDKGIVYLWTRGIVSYDDPDVSPDGEQIFGEVEDYRVVYMKTPRNMKND